MNDLFNQMGTKILCPWINWNITSCITTKTSLYKMRLKCFHCFQKISTFILLTFPPDRPTNFPCTSFYTKAMLLWNMVTCSKYSRDKNNIDMLNMYHNIIFTNVQDMYDLINEKYLSVHLPSEQSKNKTFETFWKIWYIF